MNSGHSISSGDVVFVAGRFHVVELLDDGIPAGRVRLVRCPLGDGPGRPEAIIGPKASLLRMLATGAAAVVRLPVAAGRAQGRSAPTSCVPADEAA